jgi:hypothetical protein
MPYSRSIIGKIKIIRTDAFAPFAYSKEYIQGQ